MSDTRTSERVDDLISHGMPADEAIAIAVTEAQLRQDGITPPAVTYHPHYASPLVVAR